MNSRARTMLVAFTLTSMLAAPFAEAARMGKSRNSGMQRAAPTKSYQQSAAPAQPMQQAPAAPQQRPGVGVGTAVAAGAAGAVAGYMLGSAGNNDKAAAASTASSPHSAAVAPAPATPGTNWTLVIILGAVFLAGLVWFRRRMATSENAPQQGMRPMAQPVPTDNRFTPIPQIGSGFGSMGSSNAPAAAGYQDIRRLPDGTETPYFLRQAKATFLHLQSLNSAEAMEEVRRYMTPTLFEELRADISDNSAIADFPELDCQLLDASDENGRYLASVRFFGKVSEEVNALPEPFSETWHFIKDYTTAGKWIVAGIQQN